MSESRVHRAVARFLDLALPADCWWTTIGHGGGGKVRGAKLKAAGLKAGAPDILIVYRGQALFIELKGPKGRLSPVQHETHYQIGEAGARVAMCRSVDEVETYLRHYCQIPLKASLAPRKAA